MAVDFPSDSTRQLRSVFSSGLTDDCGDGALLDRFVAARDGAAFEAIVARHGPMVHRVCRAALGDLDEAADAYQAVFLILVRKAASVRSRASLASWLFGVASRVSAHARVDGARRRKHERSAAGLRPEAEASGRDEPRDAIMALHEELLRLPDRYREVVVLCHLEGYTGEAAARRIRRPVGTVKARLSRARRLLRNRLLHRGFVVPICMLAAGEGAAGAVAAAGPGSTLQISTFTAARLGEASGRVRVLVEEVLGAMALHRLKAATFGILIVGLTAGAFVMARGGLVAGEPPQANSVAVPPPVPKATPPAQSDPVGVALQQALPAALQSSDPYLMTLALIRLARAEHAGGEVARAHETLRRAAVLAGTVKNEHLRRLASMRTAVAQGQLGDSAPAHATLERFAREAEGMKGQARTDLMSMVIDFQASAGFKDEARANLSRELAAVDAIADERTKEGGVYRLLFNQISQGDYEGALRQAARYTDERSNLRASFLGDIMRYRDASSDPPAPLKIVERAYALAKEVTYPYPQGMAFQEIAAAFARAGDIERGLSVARDIADTPQFEIRCSEIPQAMAEIARVQASAGDLDGARKTLREGFGVAETSRQRDMIHAERVRRLAEAQAEIGDLEGAKASVAAIEHDPMEMALARCALARAQFKAGDAGAARATLREAVMAARNITARKNMINDAPAANSDQVFRAIAVAQAETGDANAAVATISGRGSREWQSEALAAVAPMQARSGDIPGALATAAGIPDTTRAGEAYAAIASIQARSGDDAAALKWALQLRSPVAKAMALIGIREGLVKRKAEK